MPKQKLTSNDFDSYCRLRVALDALRDAALVQYALCGTGQARTEFTHSVEGGVKTFLDNIIQTPEFMDQWIGLKKTFLAELSSAKAGCPPGFVEVNGRCVRIPVITT